MIIAVDGFEASASDRVGVGRLETELLRSLEKHDKTNRYRIYCPQEPRSDLPPVRSGWEYKTPMIKRLWSQVGLSVALLFDVPKPDVFFAPIHYAPRYCPFPIVLGIMDLAFLHYPDLFRKQDLYKLTQWTNYSIKKAQEIITISNATKNDILKQYNIASGNVHVVYPGFTSSLGKNSEKQIMKDVQTKFGITNDYILYVGTLQPRKNVNRLIDAFKKLENRNLQLVIVGKKGWMYDEIFKKVEREQLQKRILFTGYVSDSELATLYENAQCFCLVSLYEGFGFPVLEAMQKGTPVVASDISSLPELVGDGGILVDPKDVEDITKGINKILNLSDGTRALMIEKGKKQASKFTWDNAAKQTIEIFEKVGNES